MTTQGRGSWARRLLACHWFVFAAWLPLYADHGDAPVLKSGGTLYSRGWSQGVSTVYMGVREPGSGSRETEELFLTSLAYGFTENWTAALIAPASPEGLGDVSLLTKYRLFYEGGLRTETSASVILGLQLPSGQDDGELGSGSWDLITGAAISHEWDEWGLRCYVANQFNTRGFEDEQRGDLLVGGVELSWRFLHAKYPGPEASISIGLSWEHAFATRIDGERDPDSGYDQLLVGSTLSVSPRAGWSISLFGEVPVYQQLRGEQEALDFRVGMSLTVLF